MTKPLLLKSKGSTPFEQEKHNILTVSEVLKKFQLKSPSHKLPLSSANLSTINKKISSPNKNIVTAIKIQRHFDVPVKTSNLSTFQKSNSKLSQSKQKAFLKNKNNSKEHSIKAQQYEKFCKNKIINMLGQKRTQIFYQNQSSIARKRVSNMIRELNCINLSSKKEKKVKIPSLQLQTMSKFSRPAPFSDRFSQDFCHNESKFVGSTKSTNNIKLHLKKDDDALSIKTCKNGEHQNFFRKGSASTLSLHSKHTVSMQQFQNYEELFTRKSSKIKQENQCSNQLIALEDVKHKIYQQISSLDKKLLSSENQEQKPIKIICLRKKRQKTQELTTAQGLQNGKQ